MCNMTTQMLGDLEKEIMEIVWKTNAPISVKTVTEIIQQKRKIAYTTVMTIMGRLIDKKLLKRSPEGRAYLYQSSYSKEKFLTKVSQQIIKNFVANFGEVAVAHFAEEIEKIPEAKRRQLTEMLKNSK